MINHLLLVAAGGAIGASLRHLAGMASLRLLGPAFPYATVLINVTGSLIMGLFIAWLVKKGGSDNLRLFFATGILGGFTTFSAFSLDVADLLEHGAMGSAFAYVLISVFFSILAVFVGLWFGRAFL